MAAGMLERYPSIRLTATDVDPAMVDPARHRC
jgi:trans-aconitate methyltransferase